MYEYSSTTMYYKGVKVSKGDRVFIAKEDNMGHHPPMSRKENYWWKLDEENDEIDKFREAGEANNMNGDRKTAEKIFCSNIGKEIVAQLICAENDTRIFTGVLAGVYCNTFIIRTHGGAIEMFRYEDIRYLYCKTLADMGKEISFRVKDSDTPHKFNFDEVNK